MSFLHILQIEYLLTKLRVLKDHTQEVWATSLLGQIRQQVHSVTMTSQLYQKTPSGGRAGRASPSS